MEVSTKFNIGDTFIAVEPCGIKVCTVRRVEIDESGVSYVDKGSYRTIPEALCFRSSDELKAYVDAQLARKDSDGDGEGCDS